MPKIGQTVQKFTSLKNSVDYLMEWQNFYLNALIRFDIMRHRVSTVKQDLHARLDSLDALVPLVRAEKEKIEKSAKVEETRLDTEPVSTWFDFWT